MLKRYTLYCCTNTNIYNTQLQYIILDETNRYSLKQIEQSLIVVCLDKSIVDNGRINLNDKTQRQTMAVAQTIHGGGSAANSYNRWFDKTIQVYIICMIL